MIYVLEELKNIWLKSGKMNKAILAVVGEKYNDLKRFNLCVQDLISLAMWLLPLRL